MKCSSVLAVAALLCGVLCPQNCLSETVVGGTGVGIIEHEYLVLFKSRLLAETRQVHMDWLGTVLQLQEVSEETGSAHVMDQWAIEAPHHPFHGYALYSRNRSVVEQVARRKEVQLVEHNTEVHAMQDVCQRQIEAPWNLERISKPDEPLASYYEWTENNAGDGVEAFIFDTGVRTTHIDFHGRAQFGIDTTSPPDDPIRTDDNGHGTFIAGIVGSAMFGVAKNVSITSVKVLNQAGSGSVANVIRGLEYASLLCNLNSKRCVGVLAFGGGINTVLNSAVNSSVDLGVFMAVAAGNGASDACDFSPASASLAATTGATDNFDSRTTNGNYGRCLTIFAPGTSISSTWYSSDTATITLSGSSAAAAHVAGVAARIFSHRPTLNAHDVLVIIPAIGAHGRVVNPGAGSPNILLQGTCLLD